MQLAIWLLLLLPPPGIPGKSQLPPTASAAPQAKLPAKLSGLVGRLRSFVPAGYQVILQKKGDLNLDGKSDALLILGPRKEAQRYEARTDVNADLPPRLLLLLMGVAGNQYQLRVRSAKATYRFGYCSNFRDSLDGITIKRGKFTIYHYSGQITRTARTTTFTYQPATASWLLTEDEENMFYSMYPEDPHIRNLLKHRVSLGKFNIYE